MGRWYIEDPREGREEIRVSLGESWHGCVHLINAPVSQV
jgi:hypothetical protein